MMKRQLATSHLRTLAEGTDPIRRRPLATDDSCRHPDIRRTLLAAIVALEQMESAGEERGDDALPILRAIASTEQRRSREI